MIFAEPQWLKTLGDIAGTLLLLELCFVLLLVCVIVGALAYGSWWLHHNVIPILDQYGGKAQQYMDLTIQGSQRVVTGVAEFHGRWEAIATGARVMFFGTRNAKRSTLPANAAAPSIPDAPETGDSSQLTDSSQQIGLNGHDDQLS